MATINLTGDVKWAFINFIEENYPHLKMYIPVVSRTGKYDLPICDELFEVWQEFDEACG